MPQNEVGSETFWEKVSIYKFLSSLNIRSSWSLRNSPYFLDSWRDRCSRLYLVSREWKWYGWSKESRCCSDTRHSSGSTIGSSVERRMVRNPAHAILIKLFTFYCWHSPDLFRPKTAIEHLQGLTCICSFFRGISNTYQCSVQLFHSVLSVYLILNMGN